MNRLERILKNCVDKKALKYELRNPYFQDDYIIATDTRILIAYKPKHEIAKVSGVWIPDPKNEKIRLAGAIDKSYIMQGKEYKAYINGLQYSMRGTPPDALRLFPTWFLNGEKEPKEYQAIKGVDDHSLFMYAIAQHDYLVDVKNLLKIPTFDKLTIYVKKRSDENIDNCICLPVFFKDDEIGYFGVIMPLDGVKVKDWRRK